MQSSGPTTLFSPTSSVQAAESLFGVSPTMLVLFGVALVCFYLAFVHRGRRKLDPRELAFRTLSRRLGLSRAEINSIRKYAIAMGLGSPVGIVMNPEMTAQALGCA
ncbi:MAG: hypothetical protein JKX70_03165 [Phycisphaerales bacterium]|nr:hypothetical protein [Phycisphaerales bacterium]